VAVNSPIWGYLSPATLRDQLILRSVPCSISYSTTLRRNLLTPEQSMNSVSILRLLSICQLLLHHHQLDSTISSPGASKLNTPLLPWKPCCIKQSKRETITTFEVSFVKSSRSCRPERSLSRWQSDKLLMTGAHLSEQYEDGSLDLLRKGL